MENFCEIFSLRIRTQRGRNKIMVSFGGPSNDDPTEPGFDKFVYSEQDLKDMGSCPEPADESSEGSQSSEESKV